MNELDTCMFRPYYIDDLEKKLDEARRRSDEAWNECDTARHQRDDAKKELIKFRHDLMEAKRKIVELEEELDLHAHQLNPAIVQARNDQLVKELDDTKSRADKLEESLRIIGDMAVVDWDDSVVGFADKAVAELTRPSTYAERVRKLFKDAEMCEVWRARCKEAQYALAQALVPGEFCKAAMERVISARDAGKDE